MPGGRRLPPGLYRLSLRAPGKAPRPGSARIYVDSGTGFNEAERIELTFRERRDGVATGDVSLPYGAEGLRLASDNGADWDSLRGVGIRRLGRLERYGLLMARMASRYVTSPLAGVRALGRALKAVARGRARGLAASLRAAALYEQGSYQAWIERHERLDEQAIEDLRLRLGALDDPPLISVVMPVHDTPERWLRAAIDSVRAQIYDRWELCIADDGSQEPSVRRVLEEYLRIEPRIKVAWRDERGHIARATNEAFGLASGSWVALLDHDDLLRPHTLAEVVLEIARHPRAELIYTDEDKIDDQGRRYDPYFKPDFSRELFRSQNYLNHLTVHRSQNVEAVGGWRPGFEGSQDYDLSLRILERIDMAEIRHIPKILYHWRAAAGSAASSADEKSYAYERGLRALQEHVARSGLPATVEPAPDAPYFRLRFSVPQPPPRVSLIVPTRDNLEPLRRCVESIRDRTAYEPYEILVVDNGSEDRETQRFLEQLARRDDTRVLTYGATFNYSAINNFAVRAAEGSIIGLINDDIEVISADWLAEMVSWAAQDDIGCVGAKLYYPDDTIQHAGVVLGLGGVAGHSHKYFPRDHIGYRHRLKLVQNFAAVTAACLLVRKSVYEEVEGLNETDLPISFNDVDFCIRVRDAGYHNVWTPYAELYHVEGGSRGGEDTVRKRLRANKEILYMRKTWGDLLANDPYYSPHLTRTEENFSLAP